ncbi:hypothetical protein [Pedobacter terrae]|uniref:hypothetical protein n=1 Tax=Pedobacter terrae TaxID=405671 RepID=UPI000B82F608|nr:hypothetical protein [Pedobacter terrae]
MKDATYLGRGWGLKFPYYDNVAGVINGTYQNADVMKLTLIIPLYGLPVEVLALLIWVVEYIRVI